MNIKSLLFFSLLFFSSMHAMHDGPFSPLKNAQEKFFQAMQDDTNDEQQKIAALEEILDANPDNRAAILNYVGLDKKGMKHTAFNLALEKKHYDIVEYLVQQPEFDINHVENYNISGCYKDRTPLNAIIATLKSVNLAKFLINFSENTDPKEKKLIEIANLILEIHKKTINTQQLFDAYEALLITHLNDKSLTQDLLNKIINHEKFDVNHVNDRGNTPLKLAISRQSLIAIDALIGKGADLNKKYYHYYNDLPNFLARFLFTPQSILDLAINEYKFHAAKILYENGARTINPETLKQLEKFKDWKPHLESKSSATKEKEKDEFLNAINNPESRPLTVDSWSSARKSGLGAIGGLTILYDFCRFKKPEKITDDKKDTKAKITEKAKTKNDLKKDLKKTKDKKESSRLERLSKHAHNYKKDLLKNPRNHKKLMIPVACLLFRLLKDPIQYRNTRFDSN